MTDTNTFINTYIDVILGTTHTQINEIVHLKTNLKLAEIQVQQLVQQITQLNDENQKLVEGSMHSARSAAARDDDIKILNERILALTDEVNAYKTKASHIDTFTKQITDLKKQLQDKQYVNTTKQLIIEPITIDINDPSTYTSSASLTKDDF